MKSSFKYLLPSFFLLFISTTFAVNSDAPQELTQLLSNFQTMTADFNQTSFDARNRPIQSNSGEMALSRPGKFRWEIKRPSPQLLIADGKYLWIYDVDLAQATRQEMDATKTNSPASLLSGSLSELQKRFSVVRLPSKTGASFRLTPNNSDDLFQWIELNFIDNRLAQMRMSDNLGSLSVLTFTQVQINPKLAEKLFSFKAPKGVDVVQN